MGPPTRAKIMMNGVVNGIKWVIPGLLIAHGANTPERRKLAVVAVLITGFCFSAQMIVKMLPALIGGQDLAERALRVLDRDLGYHRVDLAALTAAASWAFYAFRIYASTPLQRLMCLGGFWAVQSRHVADGWACRLARVVGGRCTVGIHPYAPAPDPVCRWPV